MDIIIATAEGIKQNANAKRKRKTNDILYIKQLMERKMIDILYSSSLYAIGWCHLHI